MYIHQCCKLCRLHFPKLFLEGDIILVLNLDNTSYILWMSNLLALNLDNTSYILWMSNLLVLNLDNTSYILWMS